MKDKAESFIDASVKDKVIQEVQNGHAFDLAMRLHLPYEPHAYEYILKDFKQYDWLASDLIEKDYRAEEILNYIEAHLDWDRYLTEPDKNSWESQNRMMPDTFDFVLQSIRHRPGSGQKFVRTGICSWKRRLQNGAIKVMQCWMEDTGLSLDKISPDLYSFLDYAIATFNYDEEVLKQLIAIRDNAYLGGGEDDSFEE